MISDAYVQVECDQDFCHTEEEVELHWRSNGYDCNEGEILRRLGWSIDDEGKIECDSCHYDRMADDERFAEEQDIETEGLKELYW